MYRRQGSRPFPRKRNAKRQNDCLRGAYKKLRKEEMQKAKEKRKVETFLQCKEIEETTKWEKLEIRDQRNISCRDCHNKGQKWYGPYFTHGHHQMVNTKIRLISFFVAEDGKAVYS